MSTMLPVLTAYEKEHISERQPLPERYLGLSDEEMTEPNSEEFRELNERETISYENAKQIRKEVRSNTYRSAFCVLLISTILDVIGSPRKGWETDEESREES